jgi:phage gp16-like protein
MSTRTKMIAKLHVAKKALALTEESYRDVLRRVTGRDSAAAMTEPQIEAALKEFKRLGFKDTPRRGPTSKHAQIRMIHGVWSDICALGIDADDHAAALRAFCARQTRTAVNPQGVSAPEFLDSVQANRVLEGLKAWRTRLRHAAKRSVAA